ncbi:hypothetical protein OAG56_03190 [Mariniblastus sp.]|nr:hypothetical protein [Mariniblastus sp.]
MPCRIFRLGRALPAETMMDASTLVLVLITNEKTLANVHCNTAGAIEVDL